MVISETEKAIKELQEKIKKIQDTGKKSSPGVKDRTLRILNSRIEKIRTEMYASLTGWEKVLISRHPDRPCAIDYINNISTGFVELKGDRYARDDKAIIGGFAEVNGRTVMLIGQQKGKTTKEKQYRNFGMPGPDGYRKSLRLMKLAEKFKKPIVIFVDTPGASTGIEAEERGQAEAIGRNISEMLKLGVPVISVIIGEGASAGALGLFIGDRMMMMEYTWYSVISPESCSATLWRSWNHREEAAEALKLTAEDQLKFGFIDTVIKEPPGGAHLDTDFAFNAVKEQILNSIRDLDKIDPKKLIESRLKKYLSIGIYEEI